MITNPDHDYPINYLYSNTDSSLVSPVSLLTDRSVYTDSQKGQNAHLPGAKRPRWRFVPHHSRRFAPIENCESF